MQPPQPSVFVAVHNQVEENKEVSTVQTLLVLARDDLGIQYPAREKRRNSGSFTGVGRDFAQRPATVSVIPLCTRVEYQGQPHGPGNIKPFFLFC